jgi:uncharacterized protein (DUF305 family)
MGRQAEISAPQGFDPSNTKSLADFLAALCAQWYRSSFPAESSLLSGNVIAMSKMMTGMAIPPSGKVDPDFVHMMVPHHQGAINMAVLELRPAMYLAINERLPASAPAPT